MTSCISTTGRTPSAPFWAVSMAQMFQTRSKAAPTRSFWLSAATRLSAAMDLCFSTQVGAAKLWDCRKNMHKPLRQARF